MNKFSVTLFLHLLLKHSAEIILNKPLADLFTNDRQRLTAAAVG